MILLIAMLTIINVLVLLGGIGVLWIVTKMYTEVLKIQHIKQIGKVA